MSSSLSEIEKKLWASADELRANSNLRSSEYSTPVLGLIFLRFADQRFATAKAALEAEAQTAGSRRTIGKTDYQARGVIYLPKEARFSELLELTESENIGRAINEAMKLIEAENPDLKNALPRNYNKLHDDTLVALLKLFSKVPSIDGDAFGKIYEYFLGEFALTEGQKGGEFFTPTPLVRLIVEIIEPFHGRILDPACGSGGMFVQSARFVEEHRRNPSTDISIYGQEKVEETLRLCRMNLAVHGLGGTIRVGNTYTDNPLYLLEEKERKEAFDFVMANPPFNVNSVDKNKLNAVESRFPFGLPRTDNANYLWIQQFYSALNDNGRAGFVMANSASDARNSEQDIRCKLIQDGAVDVMIAVGPNFFYTVTLPCTLWFFDKGKRATARRDNVLFIDARHIFRQIDRAHREFTPDQIEFLANIVRLYRGEPSKSTHGSADRMREAFPDDTYRDIPGLCKRAAIAEIERQGWSLNPGRYVGVAERAVEDVDFRERLEELHEELETLNAEAHELEDRIAANVAALLDGAVE